MRYNPETLTKELLAAGIRISGCNENGVVWGEDGVSEIQDGQVVRAILKAHDPEAKTDEATLEEKVEVLWKAVVEEDTSLLSEVAAKG